MGIHARAGLLAHPVEGTLSLEQLKGNIVLEDLSIIQDENLIIGDDGVDSMCNGNQRTAAKLLSNGRLNETVRSEVNIRSCLSKYIKCHR